MKRIFIFAILVNLILACNPDGSQTNSDSGKETVDKTGKPVKMLEFDPAIAAKISGIQGEIKTGFKWEDANGLNLVFFTREVIFTPDTDAEYPDFGNHTAQLKVYHFSGTELSYSLVRLVQDHSVDCHNPPFGLEGDFYYKSLQITDIDSDDIAEISFMYYFNCASEINPRTVKLMLLENGEKYAIRGDEYIQEYYPESGKKEFDAEFEKAPASFKKHASKLWDKYCKVNPKNK